jgi:hypothetical protein
VNLFDCCVLLVCVAHAGGDSHPNQRVILDNSEHFSNGLANPFSVRETGTAHGCKMPPSFEDFFAKLFDLVRRHILLLALGGPCFAHGCCEQCSCGNNFFVSLSINILSCAAICCHARLCILPFLCSLYIKARLEIRVVCGI